MQVAVCNTLTLQNCKIVTLQETTSMETSQELQNWPNWANKGLLEGRTWLVLVGHYARQFVMVYQQWFERDYGVTSELQNLFQSAQF